MKLGDYYRAHGESIHLANVEAHLDDDWQATAELVKRSGRSRNFVSAALGYLHDEQRVERRRIEMKGGIWRWEWRRPAP